MRDPKQPRNAEELDDVDHLFARLERAAVPDDLTARVLASTVERTNATTRAVLAWPSLAAGLAALGALTIAGYQLGASLAASDGLDAVAAVFGGIGFLPHPAGDSLAAPGGTAPRGVGGPRTGEKVVPEWSLGGRIKGSLPDGLCVVGVGGREWRIVAGTGALIRLNGKAAPLDTLQAGDGVVILGQAQTGPGGRFLAHAITARREGLGAAEPHTLPVPPARAPRRERGLPRPLRGGEPPLAVPAPPG